MTAAHLTRLVKADTDTHIPDIFTKPVTGPVRFRMLRDGLLGRLEWLRRRFEPEQVLCAVQRGQGHVQMVIWLFKPRREGPENPTIDDGTGHEHLKQHSGAGSIILVDAASVQRRLPVVPFWAGIGIDLHWRPSKLTPSAVKDFATHLEPIRGVKVAGSKPTRICPNCTTRVAQPLATETHVECDECRIRFRW
jgi:hypothetical protein